MRAHTRAWPPRAVSPVVALALALAGLAACSDDGSARSGADDVQADADAGATDLDGGAPDGAADAADLAHDRGADRDAATDLPPDGGADGADEPAPDAADLAETDLDASADGDIEAADALDTGDGGDAADATDLPLDTGPDAVDASPELDATDAGDAADTPDADADADTDLDADAEVGPLYPPDELEPNDTPGTATEVDTPYARSGLSVHRPGDVDVFAFELAAPSWVTATLTTDSAAGELDLELLDESLDTIDEASSNGDVESLQTAPLAAGRYYLRVVGRGAAVNPSYALAIAAALRGGDENEVNDRVADATPASPPYERAGLSIDLATDQDWFRITADENGGVWVVLTFAQADGDLDLELRSSGGAFLARGATVTDDEVVAYRLGVGSTVYARVFSQTGQTASYALRVSAVPPLADPGRLFADLRVDDLDDPIVINVGDSRWLGLSSWILNLGTAPAPGGDVGSGTATFRLYDAETGELVGEGVKGPVFFTNSGGCGDPAYAEWRAAGQPLIPGSSGAPTYTNPGCADLYLASTNAGDIAPHIDIRADLVPDGDYLYELEIDTPGTYPFEPAWARANDRSWVPIYIGTGPGSLREVFVTGTVARSGAMAIDGGLVTTAVGDGGPAPDPLPSAFPNDGAVGRPWGVRLDPGGDLWFTLRDAGALCRDNGDGTSAVVVDGLDHPMGLAFWPNGDVVVADTGNDRLIVARAADDYASPAPAVLTDLSLSAPADVDVGPGGLLYVANSGANEVLELDLAGDAFRRVAGTGAAGLGPDGPATAVPLTFPLGLDVTDAGLLLVADAHDNRIRAVNLTSDGPLAIVGRTVDPGQLLTVAGSGLASTSDDPMRNETTGFSADERQARALVLDWPVAVRALGDRVYFVEGDNHRVRVMDENGVTHTVAGDIPLPAHNGVRAPGSLGRDVGDGGPGPAADLNRPAGLDVVANPDGGVDLIIADADNFRVRRLTGFVMAPTE